MAVNKTADAGDLGWSGYAPIHEELPNIWRAPKGGVERPPATTTKLNPIGYILENIKGNELANFTPKEFWKLSNEGSKAIFKRPGRPKLIRTFWIQTELDF